MSTKRPIIFYVHIQKTCGTSIYQILKQQQDIIIWRRRQQTNKQPHFVTGHYPYGIHDDWGVEFDYVYATFLRDPLQRWISMFYHGLAKKNPVFHNLLQSAMNMEVSQNYEQLTYDQITKFLTWCIGSESNQNIMCKQLSGMENLRNIRRWYFAGVSDQDFGFAQVYAWSGRHKRTSDYDANTMMRQALHNLKHHFKFVGLQSQGSDDQFRFCNKFNFDWPEDAPYHSESSPRFDEEKWFSGKNLTLLTQLNKFDIMLYESYLKHVKE